VIVGVALVGEAHGEVQTLAVMTIQVVAMDHMIIQVKIAMDHMIIQVKIAMDHMIIQVKIAMDHMIIQVKIAMDHMIIMGALTLTLGAYLRNPSWQRKTTIWVHTMVLMEILVKALVWAHMDPHQVVAMDHHQAVAMDPHQVVAMDPYQVVAMDPHQAVACFLRENLLARMLFIIKERMLGVD